MNEADYPLPVDDHLGGHPTQLEQVNLLPIQLQYAGLWIRQPSERKIVFAPVGRKSPLIFWTDHHDARLALDKFLIVLAQLRHMPLAEWSDEPSVEYKQEIRLPF